MTFIVNILRIVIIFTFVSKSIQTKEDLNCDKIKRDSYLWTMKRNPPVHFFGTIHVPYTRVWDYIPQNSKLAFSKSDNIYFELDLTDASTISALTRCQMLPGGKDLRQVLPHDLYQRLKQHLDYVKQAMPHWISTEQQGKGLYPDYLFEAIAGNWERKRPVWVMLMVNSLTEADIRSRGIPVLDLYLAKQADRMGKLVGAVEKVDEQCKPLNGLNMTQVLFALNHTLMMQEKMRQGDLTVPYTTDDLIKQYNCGYLDSVIFDRESSQVPQMKNNESGQVLAEDIFDQTAEDNAMATDIDSYFKNELIYRRNERMAERVIKLIKENPDRTMFFAFGAGHFLGNGSVIDFLRQRGYVIEHNKADNSINAGMDNPSSHTDSSSFPIPVEWMKNEGGWSRSNPNKQRRSKSRRVNSDRRSRSRGRKRKKQGKRKNKNDGSAGSSQDLWMRLGERTGSHTVNPELLSYGVDGDNIHQQIRVINRYPTAFPPHVYNPPKPKQPLNNYDYQYSWSPYSAMIEDKNNGGSRDRTHGRRGPHPNDLSMALWAETYRSNSNGAASTKMSMSMLLFSTLCTLFLTQFFGSVHFEGFLSDGKLTSATSSTNNDDSLDFKLKHSKAQNNETLMSKCINCIMYYKHFSNNHIFCLNLYTISLISILILFYKVDIVR